MQPVNLRRFEFVAFALSVLVTDAVVDGQSSCLASGKENRSSEIKEDPRLKVPINQDFKKPTVRELLDFLGKTTGVTIKANAMVEMKEEALKHSVV